MADTEALCFSEYIQDFQEKEFQVEEFISKCRKKVTVECLRRDLDIYYRTLKSAMVELINKDYADFVNLSANLVCMTILYLTQYSQASRLFYIGQHSVWAFTSCWH